MEFHERLQVTLISREVGTVLDERGEQADSSADLG